MTRRADEWLSSGKMPRSGHHPELPQWCKMAQATAAGLDLEPSQLTDGVLVALDMLEETGTIEWMPAPWRRLGAWWFDLDTATFRAARLPQGWLGRWFQDRLDPGERYFLQRTQAELDDLLLASTFPDEDMLPDEDGVLPLRVPLYSGTFSGSNSYKYNDGPRYAARRLPGDPAPRPRPPEIIVDDPELAVYPAGDAHVGRGAWDAHVGRAAWGDIFPGTPEPAAIWPPEAAEDLRQRWMTAWPEHRAAQQRWARHESVDRLRRRMEAAADRAVPTSLTISSQLTRAATANLAAQMHDRATASGIDPDDLQFRCHTVEDDLTGGHRLTFTAEAAAAIDRINIGGVLSIDAEPEDE